MATRLPRLALLPGEPAGVGPELCVRLAQQAQAAEIVVYADPEMLLRAAHRLGLPLTLLEPDGQAHRARHLAVRPFALAAPELPGRPDPRNAGGMVDAVHAAADDAGAGRIDALVTGPVQKSSIIEAGIPFSGTTELLAQRAGVDVVMMLATDTLRVALATTHLPLRAVPDAITPDLLERRLRILRQALQSRFAVAQPRIAVLGLNPHAGEGGHLGREEIEVITPVLERLRQEGFDLRGPLPADTAFLPSQLGQVDAVFAMYHDQGLPVLKHGGFERAVNITLGLPFIRVAVDHGTALDLAGTGRADASSLVLAARIAAEMAGNSARVSFAL